MAVLSITHNIVDSSGASAVLHSDSVAVGMGGIVTEVHNSVTLRAAGVALFDPPALRVVGALAMGDGALYRIAHSAAAAPMAVPQPARFFALHVPIGGSLSPTAVIAACSNNSALGRAPARDVAEVVSPAATAQAPQVAQCRSATPTPVEHTFSATVATSLTATLRISASESPPVTASVPMTASHELTLTREAPRKKGRPSFFSSAPFSSPPFNPISLSVLLLVVAVMFTPMF